MKKGKHIGIIPLTDKVKGMPATATVPYYTINGILFQYTNSYISPGMAQRIYEMLCKEAISFKNAVLGIQYTSTQEVIIAKIKSICKNLLDYQRNYEWSQDDVASITSSIKGQLLLCLDQDDADFDLLKNLERDKEIWEDMYLPCPFKDQINVKDFCKMHKGLMTKLVSQFQLSTDNGPQRHDTDSLEQFNECVL